MRRARHVVETLMRPNTANAETCVRINLRRRMPTTRMIKMCRRASCDDLRVTARCEEVEDSGFQLINCRYNWLTNRSEYCVENVIYCEFFGRQASKRTEKRS